METTNRQPPCVPVREIAPLLSEGDASSRHPHITGSTWPCAPSLRKKQHTGLGETSQKPARKREPLRDHAGGIKRIRTVILPAGSIVKGQGRGSQGKTKRGGGHPLFYSKQDYPSSNRVRGYKAATPQLNWEGEIPSNTRGLLRRRGRLTHDDSPRRTRQGRRRSWNITRSGRCLQISTRNNRSSVPN